MCKFLYRVVCIHIWACLCISISLLEFVAVCFDLYVYLRMSILACVTLAIVIENAQHNWENGSPHDAWGVCVFVCLSTCTRKCRRLKQSCHCRPHQQMTSQTKLLRKANGLPNLKYQSISGEDEVSFVHQLHSLITFTKKISCTQIQTRSCVCVRTRFQGCVWVCFCVRVYGRHTIIHAHLLEN